MVTESEEREGKGRSRWQTVSAGITPEPSCQRKDGRWCAALYVGSDINGRPIRHYYYADARRDVQEKLTKALSDAANGLVTKPERQTVSGYLGVWLEDIVKRTCRQTTYLSYRQLVENHISPALGKTPLTKLSPQQVRRWLNELQDAGKLSARTRQYAHGVLRKALNDAVRDQSVVRNVAALVQPPRVTREEIRPFTPDEARAFLGAIAGDRLEGLFTVGLTLGLRRGEILGLRWRDIDLEAGSLKVQYSLQRFGKELHLTPPKTERSRRLIRLPQITLSALIAHKERQDRDVELAGSAWRPVTVQCGDAQVLGDDFVFTSSAGTPVDPYNLTRKFHQILKQAGLPRHRIHDLRHSCATLLTLQGLQPKAIMGVLGWDQLSMVDRYTHVVDEMRRDVADKMDAILAPRAADASTPAKVARRVN